jgi:hypothetical protein
MVKSTQTLLMLRTDTSTLDELLQAGDALIQALRLEAAAAQSARTGLDVDPACLQTWKQSRAIVEHCERRYLELFTRRRESVAG